MTNPDHAPQTIQPANDNPGAGAVAAFVLRSLVDLLAEVCSTRLTAANDNASPSFTD